MYDKGSFGFPARRLLRPLHGPVKRRITVEPRKLEETHAMKRRTSFVSAAAALAAPAVRAQTAWPHGQAIRVIVPFPAGAANDAMGRLEPVAETSDESKAYIAAEVPKHVALLKKAGFEAR